MSACSFSARCPRAVQASVVFTSIAGGNVVAALCSASLSGILGIVLTPLLVGLLLQVHGEGSVSGIGSIAAHLLLPFLAGQILQAIPDDIYESAQIDGASGWKSFRFITLPLLTPTLLFLILINTIQSFQAFTQFNVLIGNEGPDNATNVFVYSIFTAFWKDNRYGFASAMSVVLFLILLVLTFIQFRLLDRRVHYQ